MNISFVSSHFFSREKIAGFVREKSTRNESLRIVTMNSEFFVRAKKDAMFGEAIGAADAYVRDGFGLGLLFWLRGQRAPERVTGADLLLDLLALANACRWTVFVANRKGGLSAFKDIQRVIHDRYPNVVVEGSDFSIPERKKEYAKKNNSCSFSVSDFSKWSQGVLNATSKIRETRIIFCSFGAPEQELFLYHLQQQNIAAVLMGIGGALDFLTKKQLRAPFFWRRAGLEWLYRLTRQPKRVGRIATAVFVFPILAVRDFFHR